MVNAGIEQLMNSCLSFFYIIYNGGVSLFAWFTTPIEYTGDDLIDLLIEPFVGYTPFELSYGVLIVSVLFMIILRFTRGISSV